MDEMQLQKTTVEEQYRKQPEQFEDQYANMEIQDTMFNNKTLYQQEEDSVIKGFKESLQDMNKLHLNTNLIIGNVESFRYKAARGRKVSRIVINHKKTGGDSDEMSAVKKAVFQLEKLIMDDSQKEANVASMDFVEKLEGAYSIAIMACQYYCNNKNPLFRTGKERKKNVEETMQALKEEMTTLAKAKEMIKEGSMTDCKSVDEMYELADKQLTGLNKEESNEKSESKKNPITALKYSDFINMMGMNDDGFVYVLDGKVKVCPNVTTRHFRLSYTKDEIHGRVRMQFYLQVLEKLGKDVPDELWKRIAYKLRLEDLEECERPLKIKTIREVLLLVNENSSIVAKTLKKGREESSPIDYKLANAVNKMVGGTMEASERLHASVSAEKIMRAEIKTILHKAKSFGVDVPSLDTAQLDGLVKGNISYLRDEIFKNMQTVYRYMSHLNQGNAADINALVAQEEVKTTIAALTIKKLSASSENSSILAEVELKKAMAKAAFETSKNKSLMNAGAMMFVEGLALEGSAGLEEAIQKRLPKEKEWQKDSVKLYTSMGALKELCDNMKKLNELQSKALEEGLTKEEAEQIQQLGAYVKQIVSDEGKLKEIEMVSDKLVNTRFYNGVKELKQINGEIFTKTTKRIALSMTTEGKHGELKSQKELESLNRKESVPTEEEKRVKVVLSEQEKTISKLSKEAQNVISILSLKKNTSDYLSPKNKHRRSYKRLYSRLKDMKSGVDVSSIKVNDVEIELVKNRYGMLDVIVNNHTVSLPYSPELIANRMESDMIKHMDLFEMNEINAMVEKVNEDAEDFKNVVQVREFYANLIEARTKKELKAEQFANASLGLLMECAHQALGNDLKKAKEQILSLLTLSKSSYEYVNTEEVLSLMKHAEKQKNVEDNRVVIQKKVEVEETQAQWAENEEAVKNLLADLIFFKDTWKTDELKNNSGERIRIVLLENKKALAMLLRDLTLIDKVFDKMGLPGDMSDMKSMLKDSLYEMIEGTGVIDQMKEMQQGMSKTFTAPSWLSRFDKRTAAQKEADEKRRKEEEDRKFREKPFHLLSQSLVETCLEKMLTNDNSPIKIFGKEIPLDGSSVLAGLPQIEKLIDKAVTSACDALQTSLNQSLDVVLGGKTEEKEEKKEEKKEEEKKDKKKDKKKAKESEGTAKLEKMLQESASDGEKGQGAFTKKVLSNYFKDVGNMDKRSMLAAAFRYAKPTEQLDISKFEGELDKDIRERQIQKEKERIQEKAAGALLGSILKGAGPLMQKMFQGMPDAMLPEALRPAIKDMKSKLAPIPEPIVKAEMQSIIDRSKGSIERVEVTRSLGAASVGQAFLCKLYGPNLPDEGKEVVVKLLRPDVKNRMMREKELMLKYAKESDSSGGMLNTYQGQLQRIEEELNLTLEAQNVEKAAIYDQSFKTVGAMKLNKLVEPTPNVMVLEKAEGETVDKYIESCREKLNRIKNRMKELKLKNKAEKGRAFSNGEGLTAKDAMEWMKAKEELFALYNEMHKRQGYLADLANVWVKEGIYENGFYHGDLHAGNMMISDKGVTVIDFGNATTLTAEKQKHVIRMMFAAATGEVGMYRDSFKALLENTSPKLYKEKEADLTKMLNDVLKSGSEKDTALRIIVSLTKAQELGLEVPSAIFNFAQSQIRLQNAMESMQGVMKNIKDYSSGTDIRNPDFDFMEIHGNIFYYETATMHTGAGYEHAAELKKISDTNKEEFIEKFHHSREAVIKKVDEGVEYVKNDFEKLVKEFSTQPGNSVLEGIYGRYSIYLVNYLGNEAANAYCKRLAACAKEINSTKDREALNQTFEGIVHEIFGSLDSKKEFVKNAKVQNTENGLSGDEQNTLDEIYKLYNNAHINSAYGGQNFTVGAIVEDAKSKYYFDNEAVQEVYAADKEHYGEEIEKAHKEFKAVWQLREAGEIPEDYAEKYTNYIEVLRKYAVYWIGRVEKTLPYHLNKGVTTFLDVMGKVILENKRKSLSQLGAWQAIKMAMRK